MAAAARWSIGSRDPASAGAPPQALIIFFLSGFAALLYQVIWQRLLVLFSGADVFSATIVVAAFMAGLGAGSLVGGRMADRIGASASLALFAMTELLIGAFGLISKWLYYDVLYLGFPELAASRESAAAVLFCALFWPTFVMGFPLPLLSRALSSRLDVAGRVVGSLYGWNTLGAAMGALVGTWVLVPHFGLEASLRMGAALNLTCAAWAVALSARGRAVDSDRRAAPHGEQDDSPASPTEVLPFRVWVLIYGVAGFVALALELTWFRVLGVILKSTAFTFGTLLCVYLSGLGLGAAIAARYVGRSRRPGETFLLLQYGLTLYVALSTMTLVGAIAVGRPAKLVRYLGRYEPIDIAASLAVVRRPFGAAADALGPFVDFAMLYVAVPALLIGPPTVLMGVSFPYLQKASHSDLARLGQRLGILLATNIAGGVLGATLAGLVLLPAIGTGGTLKLLVGMGAIMAVPFAYLRWPRRPSAAVRAWALMAAITTLAVVAIPSGPILWARLHAAPPTRVIVDEDGAGVSLLKAEQATFLGTVGVYVNGLGQSWIPYGNVHTALGALPVLLHPAPADVLIIGLGSGDTAFAAAGRPEVQRLVSVEILGAQFETLRRFALVNSYPGLIALLSDPRVDHRVGDGRTYILHGHRLFDVIEADALRPTSAHAGNLYSREYFELLRRHLKPGGLAVTWAPTDRVQRTFLSVYPHVLAFGEIWIGSQTAMPYHPAALASRAAALRHYYQVAGIDIVALLGPYLEPGPQSFGPDHPRGVTDLNTDLFPRDEFTLPF